MKYAVNPIGISLVVLLCVAISDAASLRIDFGSNHNGTRPYLDWQQWTAGWDGQRVDVNRSFNADFADVGSQVNIRFASQYIYTRNYHVIGSGPYASMSNLLSDKFLMNSMNKMRFYIMNLEAGDYELTSYHHDTLSGNGATRFNLEISDADRSEQTIFTDVRTTGGTSPGSITTLTYQFRIDETGEMNFLMRGNPSGGDHMSINGFELTQLSTPAPPAPAIPAPLAAAACVTLGLVRILRRP